MAAPFGVLHRQNFLSNQFHVLVKEMAGALDILPLNSLNLSTDTREQVQLLHRQAKRVDLLVDPRELQKREELLQIMMSNNQMNSRDKGSVDFVKVKEVLSCIGLRSQLDYEEEISKLEAEAEKQAGTGGLFVVSIINNLISLVTYSKSVIFIDRDKEEIKKNTSSSGLQIEIKMFLHLLGHQTCPKSGQRLIHMALIPNYALKSLVHQWCQDNNVPLIDDSSSSKFERSSSMSRLSEKGIGHKSATKAAMDAVKMTAEFLVGKLATGSPEAQRQAAYELRLLAKTGMGNRRIIAEAGAIPFLGKPMEARENAAATIYSLSIINDCTVTIGTRPRAFSALVGLLREGTSTGKKDAASALFNLSVYKANKESVVVAGAVPLLVEMLMDDKAGITDDALALLALLLGCSEGLEEIRKSRVLVPLLIDLLRFGSTKGKEKLDNSVVGAVQR
ncbi:U-BOX DOMAIN-CONTAINING PROTEIN 1 [Salix viminalis]|uniref:U-BOX DOMAIN-CONTAINING PROTEIN 1 n=1 Tax=Salix viminalis TaxID=40686 RepID=A0A9Q0TZC8_SALVM|nr:U-BOX DOMAIN-CONTAINING PROTEIN 1 [Salix viminalis]